MHQQAKIQNSITGFKHFFSHVFARIVFASSASHLILLEETLLRTAIRSFTVKPVVVPTTGKEEFVSGSVAFKLIICCNSSSSLKQPAILKTNDRRPSNLCRGLRRITHVSARSLAFHRPFL